MKLLLFYTHDFWMKPFRKGVAEAPDAGDEEIARGGAVVAWIHADPADGERSGKVVTKAVKNIKWIAGKFGTRSVVLHFFAHLAAETAPADLAQELVEAMRERLEAAGYEAVVTPFGYFTEFRMHVAGESLGKVFVEI